MELKKALTVCLISLFSATLVLLIARVLDLNTASRLEEPLTRIADELEAIRRSGGISTSAGAAAEAGPLEDQLVVYCFHGSKRCAMCLGIEAQTKDVVQSYFAEQLDRGEIACRVLNFEESAGKDLAEEFEVQTVSVVLAKWKDGQIEDSKRLDRVLGLWEEEEAFGDYVREEIARMLPAVAEEPEEAVPDEASPEQAPPDDTPAIPIPYAEPPDMPIPTGDEEPPVSE